MSAIVSALTLSLRQMPDRRFRRVFLLGIILALALLFGIYVVFLTALQWMLGDSVTLPWIGTVTWVNDLATWSSALLMLGLSTFLMVPVASAMTGIFLDDVAEAVEDRHYPGLPAATPPALITAIIDSLRFLGVILIANLLALVLYLLFAPFAPLIFWSLNGYLLGREYFTMAALRRVDPATAKKLRRRHALTIWLAGGIMAFPLSIPLVNLLVPVIGAAVFTHLFHGFQRQGHQG